MKSNLSTTDFKKRLAELTSKEKDFYFLTPYNSSGTPFCGEFDDNNFELTRNSFFKHVNALVIKGEYKALDEYSSDVTYTIGLSSFGRNLSILIYCFAFGFFNAVIFINQSSLNDSFLLILLTINGVLIFSGLLVFAVNGLTKRIVNQRFKEEFEIDVQ